MGLRGASRRAVLAAGWGVGAAAIGARAGWAGPAAAPGGRSGPQRAVAFLDRMMDGYGTGRRLRLPQSYADQVGLHRTTFTYDVALTILAYLTDCRDESLDRAGVLGKALRFAQKHDPQRADGRLRQAYEATLVGPDGRADIGGPFHFTGVYLGDLAWTGLAYCALARRTGEPDWVAAARQMAGWILSTCRSDGPLAGFRAGLARDGVTPLAFLSTSHNAALTGFLRQLCALTGEARWDAPAAWAEKFVRGMWHPAGGYFRRGSIDGRTVIDTAPDIDSQAQGYLALDCGPYHDAVDWAARALSTVDTHARPNSALPAGYTVSGITVSTASRQVDPGQPIEPGLPHPDPDAVWLEGCAQLATAQRRAYRGGGGEQLDTIADVQCNLGRGQTLDGRPLPDGIGVVSASSPLSVGFDPTGYYPVRHIGTTAWYLMAAAGYHPFAGPRPDRPSLVFSATAG